MERWIELRRVANRTLLVLALIAFVLLAATGAAVYATATAAALALFLAALWLGERYGD